MTRLGLAGLLAAALMCMAGASDPADRLKDPIQEARAEHLFAQLRCVVCQNESIDDSEADLARDLRQIVRQQVAAGRTDAQIRSYLVARYGEFILLKPTFSAGNSVLWLAPLLIVLCGGAFFAVRSRGGARLEAALTPEEESKLVALQVEAGDRDTSVSAGTQRPVHDGKVS
jgi:cytochrome c-type biogenesis protein CcmH